MLQEGSHALLQYATMPTQTMSADMNDYRSHSIYSRTIAACNETPGMLAFRIIVRIVGLSYSTKGPRCTTRRSFTADPVPTLCLSPTTALLYTVVVACEMRLFRLNKSLHKHNALRYYDAVLHQHVARGHRIQRKQCAKMHL